MDENNAPVQDTGTSAESTEEQQQLNNEQQAQQQEQQIEQSAGSEQSEQQDEHQSRFERRQERHMERLTDQIARGMAQREAYRQQVIPPTPPYQPLRYEEAEYDREQLERDRQLYGQTQYQQGIQAGQAAAQQEFFVDRLERDTDYVGTHYPQLDENSDEFNADLADNMNRMYLATIGYNPQTGVIGNPGIRYRDFARAFMDSVDKFSRSLNADTATNVARQAGRAGVRPTGSRREQLDLSNPQVIANMDRETYEKNRDAIQERIMQELGA